MKIDGTLDGGDYSKGATDTSSRSSRDLAMSGYGGNSLRLAINVQSVLLSFARESHSYVARDVALNRFSSCRAERDFFAANFRSVDFFGK